MDFGVAGFEPVSEARPTNVAIKSLQPEDRPYKRSGSGGLFIHVQPNGAKLWRFAYRFAGKGGRLELAVRCRRRAEVRRIATRRGRPFSKPFG